MYLYALCVQEMWSRNSKNKEWKTWQVYIIINESEEKKVGTKREEEREGGRREWERGRMRKRKREGRRRKER